MTISFFTQNQNHEARHVAKTETPYTFYCVIKIGEEFEVNKRAT